VLIFASIFWVRSQWVLDDLSFTRVTVSDDDFADHRLGIRTGPRSLELYSSRAIYLADSLFLVNGLKRDLTWASTYHTAGRAISKWRPADYASRRSSDSNPAIASCATPAPRERDIEISMEKDTQSVQAALGRKCHGGF